MKFFFTAAIVLAAPAALLAQTPAPAKPAPKAAAAAPAASAKPAAPKPRAPIRRSAAKVVEEMTPVDDDTSIKLTPEDLEIAKRVYVGTIPCELGASVTITPNERRPGFFLVQTGNTRFRMHPVESRTGAIRLEDPRAGAMWLQLGNKSMLMSQKLGQRLADECMSPAQLTYADEIKKNPLPSILDPLPAPARAASAAAGTGSAQSPAPAASAPR
jgi:hypothetical protein